MNFNKDKVERIFLIVDLDDTLAHTEHRQHLLPNWEEFHKACGNDPANKDLVEMVKSYEEDPNVTLLFVTGRTGYKEVKENTMMWLNQQGFKNPEVRYRMPKIFMKSEVLKLKIINSVLSDANKPDDIHFVIIEDRQSIIDKFKKEFGDENVSSVLVDIKNKDKNPAKELKEIMDFQTSLSLKKKALNKNKI